MKIPPIRRQQMITAYARARARSVAEAPGTALRPDAVEISPDATSFSETFRAVMQAMRQEAPEARGESVAAQVHKGEYDVPPEEIAGAILRGVKIDREV